MKNRKWIWILVAILALSLIAASYVEVYIKAGVSKTVQVGKMGAFVANSYYTGHLKVSQKSHEPATGKDRLFPLEKMVDVRFKDLKGKTITHINGTWYVFYNLTNKEMKLFKEKKISIFYYDPWPKKWKECYTWKVNRTDNRVACRIVNFGLYGLGKRK